MADPNIIGGPQGEAPEGLRNLPAPARRSGLLDGLPVSAVLRVLNLAAASRRGAFGKDDGAGLGLSGRQR